MPDPHARAESATLMKVALRSVRTTYALRLDADTSIDEGLERVIAAVAMSNADICSVKVEAERPLNAVAKLQALEYRIAMLSRHYRPWMTSGACFIGKTKSLRLIFAHHSLWTPGEDIETGRTAHALKLKIRHADFVVRTEVPELVAGPLQAAPPLVAGAFRHTVVNADRISSISAPDGLHASRGVRVVRVQVVEHARLAGAAGGGPARARRLCVGHVRVELPGAQSLDARLPLYALFQSLVMPPLGACTYFLLARKRGYLGRYQFGYRRGPQPLPRPA